jgi:hypothetical protein
MTIRFAPARPLARLHGVRLDARVRGRAANDNAAATSVLGHSAELRAALKHFAQHGLGAARVAQANAERAFFYGDRQAYLHWLGICRTLDRRMASTLATRVTAQDD